MEGFYHHAWSEIDLAAIRNNIHCIRSLVGDNVAIMAIVKDNAYGHGALPVTKAVLKAGANRLGVTTIEEAIELREAGITAPIMTLGYIPGEQYADILKYNVIQTVVDFQSAQALSAFAQKNNKKAIIHIKIDSGMGRIGFLPTQTTIDEIKQILNLPSLYVEGIFSHFACADAADKTYATHQLNLFNNFLDQCAANNIYFPIKHMANSAATIDIPASRFDMVRLGMIIHGNYPSEHVSHILSLQPALSLKTNIWQIRHLPAGSYIGYGCHWQASKDSIIATMPIGYADGLPRLLANNASILIAGKRAPLVGCVCMDHIMADISHIPQAKTGEEAVLIGKQGDQQITLEEVGTHAQTISYEICTRLSNRLPRIYLNK